MNKGHVHHIEGIYERKQLYVYAKHIYDKINQNVSSGTGLLYIRYEY